MSIWKTIVLLAALSLACSSARTEPESIRGYVVRVVDGDTIIFKSEGYPNPRGWGLKRMRKGVREYRVRLKHIDAPEKRQPYGQTSLLYLSKLTGGKKTILVVHDYDRYGRALGVIYYSHRPGGIPTASANLRMVRAGMAWHYKRYSKDKRYARAERMARRTRVGLWKQRRPVAPWAYRKQRKRRR